MRQLLIDTVSDLGITLADLIHRIEERSPTDDPLDRLGMAVELAGQLERLGDGVVGHFVDAARAKGCSWAQVGSQLGVTKQAAQQKFVPAQPDLGRWTDRARTSLTHAAQEAARLGQAYVGTEHLLLGILKGENLAATALGELDVDVPALRARLAGSGKARPLRGAAALPYTPAARQAIERTLREALRLGHNYVGTEHLLIALAGSEGLAGEALAERDVTPDRARRQVIKLLSVYR